MTFLAESSSCIITECVLWRDALEVEMNRDILSEIFWGLLLGVALFSLVLIFIFYFDSVNDRSENINHGFAEMWVRARINSTAWSDTDFACLAGRYEDSQHKFPRGFFPQQYKLPEVYPLQNRDDDCYGTLYILKRSEGGKFRGLEKLDD